MSRIKRAKPSPALVIAIAALVIALGGTAIAGVAVTALDKGERKAVKRIAKKQSKKQANKQITKRAPGLSVAAAETVGGRTAAELETPSSFAERKSDLNLTSDYQEALTTDLTTGAGKRIFAHATIDLFGGAAAAEAECKLAIDGQEQSPVDQDMPVVAPDSDAGMALGFAAPVAAGPHTVRLSCKESVGSVELIYASITAIAVDA